MKNQKNQQVVSASENVQLAVSELVSSGWTKDSVFTLFQSSSKKNVKTGSPEAWLRAIVPVEEIRAFVKKQEEKEKPMKQEEKKEKALPVNGTVICEENGLRLVESKDSQGNTYRWVADKYRRPVCSDKTLARTELAVALMKRVKK